MFEAACCISKLAKDGQEQHQSTCNVMQASLKLTCFRRCCPCEVGIKIRTSWRLQVTHFGTHTHTHVSNVHLLTVHPDIPVRDTWLHAARMSCWPGPHWGAESPGRRLWNMLKANLLKFLRVAFFNVLSWTCRLALWNLRTYCRTVLCVCTQPIIVSIQLHAHNTHNHEHPPSSPLGISVQYLWQSFGWNKTDQKWSKMVKTSQNIFTPTTNILRSKPSPRAPCRW